MRKIITLLTSTTVAVTGLLGLGVLFDGLSDSGITLFITLAVLLSLFFLCSVVLNVERMKYDYHADEVFFGLTFIDNRGKSKIKTLIWDILVLVIFSALLSLYVTSEFGSFASDLYLVCAIMFFVLWALLIYAATTSRCQQEKRQQDEITK